MSGNYDLERVISCDKGGAHKPENIRYVCASKECAKQDPLLCEVCRIKLHRDHPVISVNELLTEVKHRVSTQRLKDYRNIAGTVEEAQRVCQESFVNWKNSIANKVNAIENLMQNQFEYLHECVDVFDEHHSMQVVQDIITMQKQSDLGILRNQIKSILPFMTFNEPSSFLQSNFPSKSITQPITTTLKSLSNQLLGLPPITSTDILSFQQCFLTALQTTQNLMNQQVSTLKNATRSALNSSNNRTRMQDLENNPDDSFLSQIEGDTTFLNNSLTPFPPTSKQQIPAIPLPKTKLDYSNLYSGEKSNRLQSYQQSLSLHQAANKSFMTPRGTYKASDLISYYQNPYSDRVSRGQESNKSKRGSLSQWLPAQTSSLRQVSPINAKTSDVIGATDQAAPAAVAENVLEEVQRQVNGIQKSLGDLRTSLEGQQLARGYEGSPKRSSNKQDKFSQLPLELRSGLSSVKNENNQSGIINGFSSQGFTQRGQVINGNYQQQQQPFNSNSINHSNTNNNNNSNFSDRFQKFREYSRSLSKEKGMNQSYHRYAQENNSNNNIVSYASRQAYEQSDSKGQFPSSVKKVKFQFSQELHHEFVNVSKYVASGLNDHFQTRLVLLEPTVEIIPHREVSFSFRIQSCKNMEFGQPLALGLCHKNIVEANNFEFPLKEERIRPSSAATAEIQHSPHGCYLLTSSGFLRNHAYQKQDMKKVPVRFAAEDTIICHFNPFRKTLKFTKKSSQESCTLNIDIIPLDKLYPCVRISYAQDSVEYIQEQ